MKTFEVINSSLYLDENSFRPKMNITLSIDIHAVCDDAKTNNENGYQIITAINKEMANLINKLNKPLEGIL